MAKRNYLGKNGPRLNCAQAVLAAFKDTCRLPPKTFAQAAACGRGNAPGNLCGAFWAAQRLLETNFPAKLADFETGFIAAAGSEKCAEIRAQRKLSCLGCIENAARFVENLS